MRRREWRVPLLSEFFPVGSGVGLGTGTMRKHNRYHEWQLKDFRSFHNFGGIGWREQWLSLLQRASLVLLKGEWRTA